MGAKPKLPHVDIDKQSAEIQAFIRSLPLTRDGCLLVIHGKPLLKVVVNTNIPVDRKKLKEAILARRDESRRLNQEWEAADRELWQKLEEREKKG